jgi:hypothetical protein
MYKISTLIIILLPEMNTSIFKPLNDFYDGTVYRIAGERNRAKI